MLLWPRQKAVEKESTVTKEVVEVSFISRKVPGMLMLLPKAVVKEVFSQEYLKVTKAVAPGLTGKPNRGLNKIKNSLNYLQGIELKTKNTETAYWRGRIDSEGQRGFGEIQASANRNGNRILKNFY